MITITNGSVHLCKVFTGGDISVSGEQLGVELGSNKAVQRIRPALLDPILDTAMSIRVISFSNQWNVSCQSRGKLLFEVGDLTKQRCPCGVFIFGVLQRMLEHHQAKLLHERVSLAGWIVDVREDGLMLHNSEQIGFHSQVRVVRVFKERLPRNLADDALHCRAHCFFQMAEINGLAKPE